MSGPKWNQLGSMKKIRKPMPPAEKVIPNEKDIKKNERFDWRNIDEEEDDSDYKGIGYEPPLTE